MLRPADCVNNGGGFPHVAVDADGGEEVGGFQELLFGKCRDALHHFGRVARVMLFQKLEDAARVLEGEVVFLGGIFIVPGGAVVSSGGGIPARIEPVFGKLETPV